jgi:hypothetical protein
MALPSKSDSPVFPDPLEWRTQELFRSLDVANKGYLDLKNLREGLKRIDHRMHSSLELTLKLIILALKHATSLVETILNRIDANHDGRISYQGPSLQSTMCADVPRIPAVREAY